MYKLNLFKFCNYGRCFAQTFIFKVLVDTFIDEGKQNQLILYLLRKQSYKNKYMTSVTFF